jgi:hypothetical protein
MLKLRVNLLTLLIKRGGGTGPVKPRQPVTGANSVRTGSECQQLFLKNESEMKSLPLIFGEVFYYKVLNWSQPWKEISPIVNTWMPCKKRLWYLMAPWAQIFKNKLSQWSTLVVTEPMGATITW